MKPVALVIDNDALQLSFLERGLIALGYEVTSSTSFGSEISRFLDLFSPSLVLLDLNLGPGPSGIDIARHVKNRKPKAKIVLVTTFVDIWGESRTHDKSLFDAVLNKAMLTTEERFQLTMRAALSRRSHDHSDVKGESEFSDTTLKVWRQIALGQSNIAIAATMNVSVKAIEKTVGKLATSLGVSAESGNVRVQLVRKYVERNGQLPA